MDVETRVLELRLDHNHILSLGGALMGLRGLLRLNLSNNLLQQIAPDDLIGLEDLRLLDVSHNHITTLEETSKVQIDLGTSKISLAPSFHISFSVLLQLYF